MARRKSKNQIKYYIVIGILLLVLNVATQFVSNLGQGQSQNFETSQDTNQNQNQSQNSAADTEDKSENNGQTDAYEEKLEVHFLDVDQGLCIIALLGDKVLIYDGGERDTSSFVVAYMKDLGITEIEYMISSHYDSDHVSGLIGCLNAFEVKNVIGSNYEHNSKLYQSFMDTVTRKGLTMQYPEVGEQFAFGEAVMTILSPEEITKDSNANSVAIKLSYGESDFIFTGDADYGSERDMVASGINLDCEVLSLGHHGSASATSALFLEKTTPESAVISCGKGNSYGHPHVEVVELLEAMEIELFRSDVQGTVIAYTDGKAITWSEEACNDYSDGE